jgi:DeoR family transcriptional regulator, aga operon transcriptional repressor
VAEVKSTSQRRLSILKLLNSAESVNVKELSNDYQVSEVTIRKDLRYLESRNLLFRSRGGAMRPLRVGIDIAIDDRRKQNPLQKQSIGIAAAQLIHDGDTLILDSGTTVMELAKNLGGFRELTVITNALDIASKLVDYDNMNVIIPGGILRKKSLSLVGVMAAENFKSLKCDLFFFSADGIDVKEGLSTPNLEEAHLCRLVIKASKKVIALVDSSKFQRSGLINITKLDKVDIIVTDEDISPVVLKKLRKAGIEVIVAGNQNSFLQPIV